MSETSKLNGVLLSFPTLLHLAAPPDTGGARRSWVQLAKTGEFVSTRYGKFSITRDDLSSMLHNFTTITPLKPTELPIDYDHLSMDPKKPGDGIAAGWMKKLELREDGDELWCEVEWTPDGAERIKNAEYRFVSPSFVKNHTHKDGKKIGTTLLAAAITNHPFLDGMSALTLYNFSALGDLALTTTETPTMTTRPMHLAELGQKVSFKDDKIVTPELTDAERTATYTVENISPDGMFVRLVDPKTAKPFGWFNTEQLAPAKAPDTAKEAILPTTPLDPNADAAAILMARAKALVARRSDLSLGEAVKLAGADDAALALAYRESYDSPTGIEPSDDAPPVVRPVINLRHPGETFFALVARVNEERSLRDWKAAYRLCADAFPALAEEYGQGTAL